MKQKVVGRKGIDVTIVWAPMMEGDDEAAAREAARMFDKKHVAHFYDPERRVGLAYRREVFPNAYDEALASLPADHWLRDVLLERGREYGDRPEWDIYMFFDRGAKWMAAPPRPIHFVRHLGRVGENGESLMWVDGYGREPVEGDLANEIQRLAREVAK
ncbi:MAG TPA: hypothetical protein VEC56_02980 [Candidatus Krumholzibacteria bacterium]|nr:hypothetical protein [Candidatus Krumholzibacteria bacterium]